MFKLLPYICYIFFLTIPGIAQETEILYLSGSGADNTVSWDFYCTQGLQSGKWTKIPVPSNWELHGFGKFNYGLDKDSVRGKEEGLYRYEFKVPDSWEDKSIYIVFQGVMTDAEVKINGELAGPVHKGAFYEFSYPISKLLNFSDENLLEVKVSKHSSDESVNKAERHADYWIFGGIFRPVFLEARPANHIQRMAIDAHANGELTADVYLSNFSTNFSVRAQVFTMDGQPIGEAFEEDISEGESKISLHRKLSEFETWNPESPNLYKLKVGLYERKKLIHEVDSRFGFRTIEVRKRDGIFLNGVKLKLKGVNRHTFRPEHGRASCKAFSIEDVLLMKSMNMNAVRMSHYPPDSHFLDACDSLGLLVVNELAGWHSVYDNKIGAELLEEMVIRDVNHPSIMLWSNGNEGGHNPYFDTLFAKFDIQNRQVIHPWIEYNGIETTHYRPYNYGAGTFWQGSEIVLPTEFLHGMYDGGAGAGLADYWELIWNTPVATGGFIWNFADEGVLRNDKNGIIDTDGNHAPDGILGPYHEKEGSFYAIKEIWSPVKLEPRNITEEFDGKLYVENRYLFTNLKDCSFEWKLADFPLPEERSISKMITGNISSPDIGPRQMGVLEVELPEDWFNYDVLYLSATDPSGEELYTRSYPISLPEDILSEILDEAQKSNPVKYTELDSLIVVKAGNTQYSIGRYDGLLNAVRNEHGEIPFNNGPHLSAGITVFKSATIREVGDSLQITCAFDEDSSRIKEFTWTFFPTGWAKLHMYYMPEIYDVDFDYMGVDFSYPEELIEGVSWVGKGPYRVWKNRMQGVELGVHHKAYNNTITGVSPLVYPEFKGYHANLYWAKIESKEQSFLVGTSCENVFLRLYTPELPENFDPRVSPPFPSGDISFMQAIPPIGSKTNDPWNLGPSGRKNTFFDFGPYDHWRLRSKQLTLYFYFDETDRELNN